MPGQTVQVVASGAGLAGTVTRTHVEGSINYSDRLVVHGTASISDGTSNTVLIAESAHSTATCADTNGDGHAGLAELRISFRGERSGERVGAAIVPDAGDIGRTGRHAATITFERELGSFEIVLDVDVKVPPGRPSGVPGRT